MEVIAIVAVGLVFAIAPSIAAANRERHAAGQPVDQAPASRPSGVVTLAMLMLCVYQLLFNALPTHRRLMMAGAIAAFCITCVALACLLRSPERRVGAVWAAIGVLVGAEGAAIVFNMHGSDLSAFGTKFFPLIFAACLVRNPTVVSTRLVTRLAALTALVGAMISILGGFAYISDVSRLSPFTGGADGTHASSYVLVCCLMLMIEGRIGKALSTRMLVLCGVPAILALLGLAVGTALTMLTIYLVVRFWGRVRAAGPRLVALVIFGVLVVGLGIQRANLHDHAEYKQNLSGVDGYSSGRISTWKQRAAMYEARPQGQALLGLGVGSDLAYSPVWHTAPKDSHEDFLTLLLENGLVGFLAYMVAFGVIMGRAGPSVRAQLVAFLGASAISNALVSRPMIEAIFFVSVATTAALAAQARRPEPDEEVSEPGPAVAFGRPIARR